MHAADGGIAGSLSRRTLASLVVARSTILAAGLAALTGCNRADGMAGADGGPLASSRSAVPGLARSSADADPAAVARVEWSAQRLLDASGRRGGSRSGPAFSAMLALVAQDHRDHLDRLATLLPATTPSPAPSAPPASSATPPPEAFAAAETRAGVAALGELPALSPGLAALLAQVAASRAMHADLLRRAAGLPVPDPAPPATPTQLTDPATISALARLLAGEHAAVFAFGVVTARAAGSVRERARAGWRLHQARRDGLERALLSAGAPAPAARPAYDLGPVGSGSAASSALAARVEAGLAAIAVWAVSTTSGADRQWAAGELVGAARRTATWTGRPVPFPG